MREEDRGIRRHVERSQEVAGEATVGDVQFGIGQAQANEARGAERVLSFVRVLQDYDPRARRHRR